MQRGTTVWLVRHAEALPPGTPDVPYDDRPLTARGQRDAAVLAGSFEGLEIDAVYSSPYPRAIATVEPLAQRRDLSIDILDDLRERKLVPGVVAEPEWLECLRRSWNDRDLRYKGGESHRQVRDRAFRVLGYLCAEHPTGTLVAGSHGGLMTIALSAIEPSVDLQFGLAMPMPAVYRIDHYESGWQFFREGTMAPSRQDPRP